MKIIDQATLLQRIQEELAAPHLVKLTFGGYHGEDSDLKNIYVKPVHIKHEYKLSFVYRYQRRDITKNYTVEEAATLIYQSVEKQEFSSISIFTLEYNLFFQKNKKGQWTLREEKSHVDAARDLSHDKVKERKISSHSKKYLQELRLTDEQGKVYKNAQDKWKQINHYIELLSSMLKELPQQKKLRVVDMGAGKGYLTFALYDYLVNELKIDAEVVGVEYRNDLVDLCNDIAEKSSFDDLSFTQGTIEDYQADHKQHVLIALHACDTATDDAIYQGLQQQSDLIVVAPCCHKQVRRELEANSVKNDLDFMTKHGIFLERHAEMLTDGIRALILEYHGYQTKVLEFISDAHTPKNVLIVGVRKTVKPDRQSEIVDKIYSLKTYFGLKHHYLEKLLSLDSI